MSRLLRGAAVILTLSGFTGAAKANGYGMPSQHPFLSRQVPVYGQYGQHGPNVQQGPHGQRRNPEPCEGCRVLPEKPRIPAREKRGGAITTWVENSVTQDVTPRPARDPWMGWFRGMKDGEQVKLELQQRSKPLDLGRISGTKLPMSLRHAIRSALQFKTVREIDDVRVAPAPFDSFGQTAPRPATELGGADVIPVHNPVRVTFSDEGGRSGRVMINAIGRKTTTSSYTELTPNGRQLRTTLTKSGMGQQHYEAWAENLYVTPAFDGNGKRGARVLGLASLPIGAKVRVVNVDMEKRRMPGHTVELKTKRMTGSVLADIPAPEAGAHYRLEVAFEGGWDAADTMKLTHEFKLPDPASAEVKQHGVQFYPLNLGTGTVVREKGQSSDYGRHGDIWYGSDK